MASQVFLLFSIIACAVLASVVYKSLKKRVDSLEIEIKRLNMSCVDNCCGIASLEKEVAALKEENKRLRTSSEYWRNRANHKKQKNNRRAALEKAREMDRDIRKAC